MGLIDGGIAWAGSLGPDVPADELGRLLRLNSWLDAGYLPVGAALWTRKTPVLRGFAVAILVQGAFLLAFDLTMAGRCP